MANTWTSQKDPKEWRSRSGKGLFRLHGNWTNWVESGRA